MRRRRLERLAAVLVLALAAATVVACNTVRGFGQDIQDASDAVKRAF